MLPSPPRDGRSLASTRFIAALSQRSPAPPASGAASSSRRSSPRPRPPRPRRTVRLPAHVRPTHTALHLTLDPRAEAFSGDVDHTLEVERSVRLIELHAADLEIEAVEVVADGSAIPVRVEPHPECETLVLRLARSLGPGRATLRLRFHGRVRDDLRGLYRGRDRERPWLATQLCPTDARRLLPCFDEPGTKARWTVAVTAPAGETLIANAPIRSRSRVRDGLRTTRFEQTPPLSAYLVALAVGPFEATRAVRVGDTPIRVWTLPEGRGLERHARRAAAASLERLERWFGMPHPYAKLDLVALPDFAFGAMENAGAVFFRDSVLLLDEGQATDEERLGSAETIAHELAHMWFGNLVTMAWWNDLWLNESFATWMAYVIVDDWRPEDRIWHAFMNRREHALELDALASSHPIAPPVETAEEAQENFDAITYTKGASVLRMLERHLGARAFRDGVRRYVRAHREGAATAADLWQAFEAASGEPVGRLLAPWLSHTGHPVVRATRGRDGALVLEQARFRLAPSPAAAERPWTIPWLGREVDARKRTPRRHVLTRRRERLDAEGLRADATLYANAFEAGFFRVDHGDAGLARLIGALPRLEAVERIGLVGHQWALVRAGRGEIDGLLALVEGLAGDDDPDVLGAVERVLTGLRQRLAPELGPETTERLRAWIDERFSAPAAAAGLDGARGEPASERRRRARLISIAGSLGGATPLREACLARARAHLVDGAPLPRGAEAEVLALAAGENRRGLHAALLRATARAKTPQARRRTLLALAGFDDAALMAQTLDRSLDDGLAPAVDRATLWMVMLGQRSTASATWRHLRETWARLERSLPPILLARLAGETARALPLDETPQIRAFFAKRPLAAGERVLRQLDEEIGLARRLVRRSGPALRRALGT